MALVLDVLTHLDERSAAETSRQLRRQFEEGGRESGEVFGVSLVEGIVAGVHTGDFESLGGILESTGMAASAGRSGEVVGAAFAAGITVAAGAALVDLGVKVGETFENINRQIELHTAASGKALEDLKSHADALVGSLDSSTEHLGADFGTLATRLQMTAGPALDQLTQHVEMLRDRMGDFNVGAFAGAMHNMGVSGADADNALASLVATAQRSDVPLSELVNNLAANSDLFKDLHLTAGQAANMLGEIGAKGVPATTAIMGLQMGMKAAKTQGEDFNTFIRRIADSLDYYGKKGDEVSAEQLSLAVGGPRKWADLQTAAHAYLDTVQAGAGAFQASGQSLTDLGNSTRTLGNYWEDVKNQIAAALQPPGTNVVDQVGAKMNELMAFIDAHQNDLRQMFETGIDVIEHVVGALGEITTFLSRHPALIRDVAIAFGTWEAIKAVDAVLTGLEAVGAWLVGAPAVAATAGAGVDAAMTGMAATTTAAGAEMTLAFGPVMGELAAMPAEAEVAGTAIVTSMTAADGAVIALGGAIDGAMASMAAFAAAAAPFLAVAAGVAALMGAATTFGSASGQEDTPDYTKGGATALGPDGKPLLGPDGKPIIAGMHPGSAPKPGTGVFAPGQGPDVGPRAAPVLPGAPVASGPAGDTGGPPSDLLTPADLDPKKGAKGPRLPQAPELPMPAGYGAAPRPGETGELYEAEQRVLEERHGVDETRARLDQLEHDNNATAADIQKARNDVLKATKDQNAAELALYRAQNEQLNKHASDMGELGAKIDKDFGVSKGLAGIADNITKFLGNLMMAGPLAALNQIVDQSGVRKNAPGAGGLLGMAAVSGMFGPQFMAGGAGGGVGGYPVGPFGGYPGMRGAGDMAGYGGAGSAGGLPGGDIAAAAARVLHNTGQVPLEAMPTEAAGVVASMFPQITDIGGTRMPGTAAPGTHEIGRTLDVMMPGGSSPENTTPSDLALGNQIYAYLGEHAADLGISSMIWQDQGHNFLGGRSGAPGTSWSGQSGHMNHIDVQFMPPGYQPPGGGPLQGPGAVPGPDMNTDANGAVVNPSGFSGAGAPAAHGANWDAVHAGEAGSWDANTGNGYYGGLQFTPQSWAAAGGTRFAPSANLASPEQQKQVADRLLQMQGPGAWPNTFVPNTPGAAPSGFQPRGTDTIPAMLSPGEEVAQTSAVHKYGAGTYEAMNKGLVDPTSIRYLSGGSDGPLEPGQTQGPTQIGGRAADPGQGSGMSSGGGGIAGAGASQIGGASAPKGMGAGMSAPGGGMAAGAGAGAASMGIGLAAQIAMQEAQRAIQYGGALAGIGVEGLMETFLPSGASQLAQNSWLTKIAGGLMGAQPQIPNMAGKSENKSPKGVSGMGPDPLRPPGLDPAGVVPPRSQPTPESVTQGAQAPPQGESHGTNAGQPGGTNAPAVYIEQYHAHDDPHTAGQDIARHAQAGMAPSRGSSRWA